MATDTPRFVAMACLSARFVNADQEEFGLLLAVFFHA